MASPEALQERRRAAEARIVTVVAALAATYPAIEPYPTDAAIRQQLIAEGVYLQDPALTDTMRREWLAATLSTIADNV